ncbi:MAG: ABC transporter ATP-binding protein [Candidatus Thorarchaeota archaeon]
MGKNLTLDVNNVSKSYQGNQALKNASLKWEDGILGLIGPNGAGKSTLIKLISTLTRPDSGSLKVLGKDVLKEPLEVRRRIGVLFENPVFHPKLTVFSSLCWVGEIRGLSTRFAKQQALELLEYFKLDIKSDSRLGELSAGMKQKYGLMCATIGNPPLIILDEPTSNLDPDSRRLYASYINRLANESECRFLISSHVLGELDHLCTAFAFIFYGEIALFGQRKDLKSKDYLPKYGIMTKNTQKLLHLLVKEGVKIDSINEKQITIKAERFHELLELVVRVQKEGFTDELEIVKVESETEAIYQKLGSLYRERKGV